MSSSQDVSNSNSENDEEFTKNLEEIVQQDNDELNALKYQENMDKRDGREEEISGEEELCMPKVKPKRKRKFQEERVLPMLYEEFLKVSYPISSCLSKHISIGISKPENCTPIVSLGHGIKKIQFCEKSWESFNKYLHLIGCYLSNRIIGKKTKIVLDNSNIEVENIKLRGDQLVKFRDVTKHDEKISLTPEEFEILIDTIPAINRYMSQLTLSLPMIKEYLSDTLESNAPLLYGPIDASIYNRLPHEVFVFRKVRAKKIKIENEEEKDCSENCSFKHEASYISREETNQ